MKKIIISVLILALVVGTFVAIGVNVKNEKAENAMLAQLSERHILLNAKRTDLVEKKEEYISLRATETRYGNYIVLFFDSVDNNLIDNVYPLLEKNGHKGTIVMCNGLIPGEEGNISREDFDFLLSKGWDTAIGYNSDIDMSKSDAPELFAQYLDEYMARLEAADIEIPFTYCFAKGEYHKKFNSILQERGFKFVRHYGETGDGFGSEYVEDELYYLGSGLYCAASTKIQQSVDEAYEEDLSYGISVRYIADSGIDTKVDCTTSKYQKMLTYLANTCSGTMVCTASELYEYKQQQHMSASGNVGEYNTLIAELDEEIATIDKELEEIVSKIK